MWNYDGGVLKTEEVRVKGKVHPGTGHERSEGE